MMNLPLFFLFSLVLFYSCSIQAATKHLNAIRKFYSNAIYPNQKAVIKDYESVSNYISHHVKGRMRSIANFETYDDLVEFQYGSSPYDLETNVFYFSNYTLRQYSEDGNIVSATADFQAQPTELGLKFGIKPSVDTETAFFLFDHHGKILQYDAVEVNQYSWSQFTSVSRDENINKGLMIQRICGAHTQFCNGTLARYKDYEECATFMNSLPLGNPDYSNQNNVLCRTIWSLVTNLRPQVHCPDLGRNSLKCLDSNTYEKYYDDYFPLPFRSWN